MSGLLNFLQAASNSATDTVAAPVDLLSWVLRKGGVPVPENAVGGSKWMTEKGLRKDVAQSPESLAGETFAMISPIVAAAKAPQIAAGLIKAGENAAKPRTLNPERGAIVWHGSPHKFDKFDSSKIGTGEGAQAYGHGLYLAESPNVAKGYAENVSRLHGATTTIDGAGRSVPVPLWAADRVRDEGIDSLISEWTKRAAESKAKAAQSLQPWIDESNAARFAQQLDELQAIKASGGASVQDAGNLYKVDLPDDVIARMLDWDKPLSQQAGAQASLDALQAAPELPRGFGGAIQSARSRSYFDGNDLYQELVKIMPNAEAAQVMKRAGIPGIRYLDGGSRGAGAGTSNFVIFPGEENMLRILERNGKGLLD